MTTDNFQLIRELRAKTNFSIKECQNILEQNNFNLTDAINSVKEYCPKCNTELVYSTKFKPVNCKCGLKMNFVQINDRAYSYSKTDRIYHFCAGKYNISIFFKDGKYKTLISEIGKYTDENYFGTMFYYLIPFDITENRIEKLLLLRS
jgi:DNA-binding transcriptional MerR regulator